MAASSHGNIDKSLVHHRLAVSSYLQGTLPPVDLQPRTRGWGGGGGVIEINLPCTRILLSKGGRGGGANSKGGIMSEYGIS